MKISKFVFGFRVLAGGVFALMLLSGSTTRGDMLEQICYEGFSYDAGTYLNGQTGGSGWTSAWNTGYSGMLQLSAPGDTYSGLAVSGNKAQFGTGGAYGISEANRQLDAQSQGLVYVQCLFKSGPTGIGAGTPELRLSLSGTGWTGGLGGNDGSTYVSILNNGMTPVAVSAAPLTDLNLLVYKIDYDAGKSYLWTNPDLSAFDYLNSGTNADAVVDFAPSFDSLAIYFRGGATLDEITIMKVVPEPGTCAVMVFGLIAVGMWHRFG